MTGRGLYVSGAPFRRVDTLPDVLDGAVRVGPHSTALPGMLLRVVPGVGRFLAVRGERIDFWTEPGADPAAVEAVLQGGVLGALLHQRGDLPLHATTLVSPDRSHALALSGHSGAGKSTTAYALIRRGWILLSDDLTQVTIEARAATAWPGRARLRLMKDACEQFAIPVAALSPVPAWPGKFVLDVPRWDAPAPLAAIVTLERTDGPFRLERLQGSAAVSTLSEQVYRAHYIAALGRTGHHFSLVVRAASRTTIIRTRGRVPVEEVAERLMLWQKAIDPFALAWNEEQNAEG